MGNTNNKTGILFGHLQSYCMACEIVRKNEEIETHVQTELHKENVEKCILVEGYKLETIRKVPKGYHCKRCNCLIRSIAKVKIHVSTPLHSKAKSESQIDIKQSSDCITAFGCVKIDDLAWNSIVNDTCLVCDVDVEEAKLHSEDEAHIINLIQAPVEKKYFSLYRIIDTSAQCLICNIIIPQTQLEHHLESEDHEGLLSIASEGKISKRKLPNLDINKSLRTENFISPCPREDTVFCVLCNWFILNVDVKNHIKGYHHKNMLKLHNKWIAKKVEAQFVIEDVVYKPAKTVSDKVIDSVANNEQANHGLTSEKGNGDMFEYQDNNNQPIPDSKEDPATDDKSLTTALHTDTNEAVSKAEAIELMKNTDSASSIGENPEEPPKEENHSAQNRKPTKVKKDKKCEEYKINTSISNIVVYKTKEVAPVEVAAPSEAELERTKALADEFDIKFKPGDTTNCPACNTRIGDTYSEIRTHISSIKHKKKCFKSSKISPNNYDTTRMEDYHKRSLSTYNIVQSSMVLNMKYCVDILSYQVFVSVDGRMQCYLCNKTVDDGYHHSELDMHKQLWGNCLVITSLDQEFVREVKKGVFHCGFCNAIFDEWDALLEHLMSRSHLKYKMAAGMNGSLLLRGLMQNQIMSFMQQFM